MVLSSFRCREDRDENSSKVLRSSPYGLSEEYLGGRMMGIWLALTAVTISITTVFTSLPSLPCQHPPLASSCTVLLDVKFPSSRHQPSTSSRLPSSCRRPAMGIARTWNVESTVKVAFAVVVGTTLVSSYLYASKLKTQAAAGAAKK
ncbi:unnamed protein product [Closterium sp. Yama58-4]|nr:unnamed protein product [Closterium sp. Yama58-4]